MEVPLHHVSDGEAAMTHDHRCPALRYVVLGGRVCVCDIIEEIRRETLAAVIQRIESLAWQSKGLDSTFSLRFIIQELRRQP